MPNVPKPSTPVHVVLTKTLTTWMELSLKIIPRVRSDTQAPLMDAATRPNKLPFSIKSHFKSGCVSHLRCKDSPPSSSPEYLLLTFSTCGSFRTSWQNSLDLLDQQSSQCLMKILKTQNAVLPIISADSPKLALLGWHCGCSSFLCCCSCSQLLPPPNPSPSHRQSETRVRCKKGSYVTLLSELCANIQSGSKWDSLKR